MGDILDYPGIPFRPPEVVQERDIKRLGAAFQMPAANHRKTQASRRRTLRGQKAMSRELPGSWRTQLPPSSRGTAAAITRL